MTCERRVQKLSSSFVADDVIKSSAGHFTEILQQQACKKADWNGFQESNGPQLESIL
jgi:uncharacterized protein with PIN domain